MAGIGGFRCALPPEDPYRLTPEFMVRCPLDMTMEGWWRAVAEGSGPMSVGLDGEGFVRLRWAPGVKISGDLAREAVVMVERICAGRRRPMLVDMTGTGALTRPARVVFAEESFASKIALLGKSAVDRVIANFALGVSPVPVPTRFFTAEPAALAWLRNAGDERKA
ncbi:MAG: DUF7793 family protein [Mycobacteriaceae bacterium]